MCTDLLILAGSFLLCICITKKCNFRKRNYCVPRSMRTDRSQVPVTVARAASPAARTPRAPPGVRARAATPATI
ncbi:unnamed protein product [Plutella xylostella]|uniref:(diamondback moth) hypothetical protein n=1 Tax=Plutella xylostella TaxID=51655 RepID=A0A8S4DW35_PLUXY|nr:unnamed protein product [Plutella xylostella]